MLKYALAFLMLLGLAAPAAAQTAGCPNTLAISQTTSTDLHTMKNIGHICSIILVMADAESISLTEGSGTLCATNAAAIIGNTTVGSGLSLAANSGFAQASPAAIYKMTRSADHLCLLESGSGRLSGAITYSDY